MHDSQALQIIEIAYDLSDSDQRAMQRIAECVADVVSHGPVAVASFAASAQLDTSAVEFARANREDISRFLGVQRSVPIAVRSHALALTPRAVAADDLDAAPSWAASTRVMANTGDGGGLHIVFGRPRRRARRPRQRHGFHDLAHHLALAWRVRTALRVAAPPGASTVDPGAHLLCARDLLRCALTAGDPAMNAPTPSAALNLWPAILDGEWSLLDGCAARGARYLVACKNPEHGSTLRAVSSREREVVERVLAGHAGKWIALELGVCEASVARALRTALRRIGVADPAGLVGMRDAMFEPVDGVLPGVELAVARLPPATATPSLTDAERTIVLAILDGKRIAAIARERGRSPRTVANQIASAYRKLGVTSRREVLALGSPRS